MLAAIVRSSLAHPRIVTALSVLIAVLGAAAPLGARFDVFPDVPASKELGYDITLPQRRAVIMKAGTDPQKVKAIATALAKVAASAEYKAYLKEQYATDDSYFNSEDSLKIMEEELASMKKMVPAPK